MQAEYKRTNDLKIYIGMARVVIIITVSMTVMIGVGVNNFSSGVLLDPVNESVLASVIIIINGRVFIVGRIEFDGGETFDFEVFNFVGSGVYLGDDQILAVLQSFSNGFEDRGK